MVLTPSSTRQPPRLCVNTNSSLIRPWSHPCRILIMPSTISSWDLLHSALPSPVPTIRTIRLLTARCLVLLHKSTSNWADLPWDRDRSPNGDRSRMLVVRNIFFFFQLFCSSCFINPDDMSCVRSRQRGEKDFENGATWDGELGLYYYNTRLCTV